MIIKPLPNEWSEYQEFFLGDDSSPYLVNPGRSSAPWLYHRKPGGCGMYSRSLPHIIARTCQHCGKRLNDLAPTLDSSHLVKVETMPWWKRIYLRSYFGTKKESEHGNAHQQHKTQRDHG